MLNPFTSRRPAFRLGLLLLALLLPMTVRGEALIFGVHPYLHPSVLVDRFKPLIDYLQVRVGQPIRIRVGTSYEDHIQAFRRGEVDFGYFGPASFIKLASTDQRIRPLGRLGFAGKKTFRGAVVVRTDSPYKSLGDLRGKRFAFGDPNSTLSSLVPRKMLQEAGVGLDQLGAYDNLNNHHNVALAVLLGKFDAGSVKEEVFREFEPRGLRVLQWSPDIPTHLFVAGPGLSDPLARRLAGLMQQLRGSDQAVAILSRIKLGTTNIIPASPMEYEPLRRLILSNGQ
jgi:phosphonate transport system substrate-binding protein